MNKHMAEPRSLSDKRKMSPGQEKTASWPKKLKKTGRSRRGAPSTARDFTLWTLCWSKAPRVPSPTRELEGGFRGAQSKLQRDSSLSFSLRHNRRGKRRCGLSPARCSEPKGLSELLQLHRESCTRTVSARLMLLLYPNSLPKQHNIRDGVLPSISCLVLSRFQALKYICWTLHN